MGKSKGRRKGKAASGRGGGSSSTGHGHYFSGAPSSVSSFGGGMINPSFLAAAARDAAACRQTSVGAGASASTATAASGAGSGSSNTKKKRKRADNDNESATSSSHHAHKAKSKSPNQVDSVSEKRNKVKKRKKVDNSHARGIEQDSNANANAMLTFGHPRWTDLEQLVRLLLFPLPWVADALALLPTTAATGGQSKHHSRPTPRERPVLPVRIIFVSQADQVRELAMLCKPLLHPMPVVMVHNKMKRRQLEDGMQELLASLVTCNDGDEDGMEDIDANECSNTMPARGPVIFVADSALDRMVSAFRSCRIGAGMTTTNAKTDGGKKKNKKQSKPATVEEHCESPDVGFNGRPIPLGAHFDAPQSEDVRKARSASLSSIATVLQNDKTKTAGTNRTDALEIIIDGKRSSESSNAGQDGHGVFLDGPSGNFMAISAALARNEWIPRQSDQQIVEGIVNSAKRVREGPVGSPKERSAKEKLLARMAVLDARLQAKSRLKNDDDDGAANVGLPAVSGITDVKISSVVEKMRILGMIAPTNSNELSEREAAQTRWMDNSKGRSFGGTWKGSIRYGASGDDASRDLASKLTLWRSGNKLNGNANGSEGKSDDVAGTQCLPCGKGDAWRSLIHWKPNPNSGDPVCAIDSDDEDNEGRKDFGGCPCAKACGHNETAMFYLRPFFPLEVINSRVCSKRSPAPGNSGFEGCLEYLRRLCAAAGRSMTYWDSECFGMIDGRDGGKCESGLAPGK